MVRGLFWRHKVHVDWLGRLPPSGPVRLQSWSTRLTNISIKINVPQVSPLQCFYCPCVLSTYLFQPICYYLVLFHYLTKCWEAKQQNNAAFSRFHSIFLFLLLVHLPTLHLLSAMDPPSLCLLFFMFEFGTNLGMIRRKGSDEDLFTYIVRFKHNFAAENCVFLKPTELCGVII